MQWFDRLADNPHIEQILLADSDGRVLWARRTRPGDDERAAAMLQSADVLAQALATALGCGTVRMLHITTERERIIVVPMLNSTHYLALQVFRTAPLLLLLVELERVLDTVTLDDLDTVDDEAYDRTDDTPVLDAADLIAAVQQWLRGRSAPG